MICVKAPALIEKAGLTKKGAVTLAFLNLLAWVPLIVAFLLSRAGITPVWFAILWLVNVMPGMMLSFQRDNWLSNLVPRNSLGRYLGQRLAIKSAAYLGAFFLLGYLLDSFGEKSLASFAFVFILALVMALVDFIIFTFMHEPAHKDISVVKAEPQKIKFGIFDFIGELKEKKLDTFILFTSFFYLTVGLSGPLYAVYMLQEKNFTYLGFTVIISAEYLARVVSAPFWGRYADKAGNIRVLGIVSRIIPAIPICWLFWSNIGYLAFIQTLSGICWGAFDLSTQSYLYKVAPQPKKLRYIVYTRSLILLSTALGGLLGAYLVKGVFFTFGSRLLTVFMISGFFRAIVVMFLMPKLVDLAVSYGKALKESTVNLKIVKNAAVSKHGLFYHPPEPAVTPVKAQSWKRDEAAILKETRYSRRLNWTMEEKLAKAPAAKREIMALSKNIQNTGKRNWAAGEKPVKEKKEAARPVDITPSRHPWYGNSEILAAYRSRKLVAPGPVLKMNLEKAESRQGLFYNDNGWARYMKETLQAVIRESRERRAVANMKPVFVENRNLGVPGATRTHNLPLRRY
ncbi:MAG: hypothetical protein A2Y90_01995 [Chloroflexi bacterium RBG_13_52_12]|nr:MAG: hypothetical protein A2Y90_01995 [Chloroflexi bacterium RBG_13_52_12]